MRKIFVGLLGLAALPVIARDSAADFTSLGVANAYNEFILGDSTRSSDSEGRVAVGGNAVFNGYSVASKQAQTSTSPTNLVVGGNFTMTGAQIQGSTIVGGNATYSNPTVSPASPGNVFAANGSVTFNGYGEINANVAYGTTFNPGNATIKGVATQGPTALPFDFAEQGAFLKQLSEGQYSPANPFAPPPRFGTIHFDATGISEPTAAINVEASAFSGNSDYEIKGAAGQTVVINILDGGLGTIQFHGGFNLSGGIAADHVLLNFVGFEGTLNMSGIGVQGAILAPMAHVQFDNGQINGNLIAGSLSGGGETHNVLFNGILRPPAVPEPASVAMMGLGGAGLALLARRRKCVR